MLLLRKNKLVIRGKVESKKKEIMDLILKCDDNLILLYTFLIVLYLIFTVSTVI